MQHLNHHRSKSAIQTSLVTACLFLSIPLAFGQTRATLDVDVSKPGASIPPQFYGLMTEEINHSYDGGLFAELIQNRTFQDPLPTGMRTPIHWSVIGSGRISADRRDPVNSALPISLRLDLNNSTAGVANDGYWGIPVKPDTIYTASFYAKAGGGFSGPVTATLVLDDGNTAVAKADTAALTDGWKKYTVTLSTGHDVPTTAKAKFVLSATGSGSVSFSLASLFPPTYQNTPNGLRPDLMKLMADLQPKFIRLPGGNYIEGGRFSDRFNWKKMIGPVEQRPGHMGCWGYRSCDGFGLPEYLLWCKQLNAEPVLALFAGYTLNGDHFVAGDPEMAVYVKEALEEIEYVSGPMNSEWGKKRAEDGFPEPFPLRYVEIGNEDWFDGSGSYDGRFTEMAKAVRERHPQLKIIATAPVKSFKPDLYDDHFYRSAKELMTMGHQYDKPDGGDERLRFNGGGWNGRQPGGIKTFVGEWATQEGSPTPDVNAALADSAFIMGLEQNGDAIDIQCYAPLLCNVSPADAAKGYPRGWQWPTNLIGYDALHSFGSPSYYAQAMLSQNKGDVALASSLDVTPVAAPAAEVEHGGIGFGSWHTQVEYRDVSVTAADGHTLVAAGSIKDSKALSGSNGDWTVQSGVIKPVNSDSETWAVTGDSTWKDYTIHLRARKTAGQEGFIILWHAVDGDNYRWWNLGGWGNTRAQSEAGTNGGREGYGDSTPIQIETGRWYELRLEITGSRMKGFVDGKLVTDAAYESRPTAAPVFASATYLTADHTVIVKLVNTSPSTVDTAIHIHGVAGVEPNATVISLTGEPKAVNSLEEPMKVSPKTETISDASTSFHRTLQPHSLTVMRVKADGGK